MGRTPLDLSRVNRHIPTVNYLEACIADFFRQQQGALETQMREQCGQALQTPVVQNLYQLLNVPMNAINPNKLARKWTNNMQAFLQGQLPPPPPSPEDNDPTLQANVDELLQGIQEGIQEHLATVNPALREELLNLPLDVIRPYATALVREVNKIITPQPEPIKETIEEEKPALPEPPAQPRRKKKVRPAEPAEKRPVWSIKHTFIPKRREGIIPFIQKNDIQTLQEDLAVDFPNMPLIIDQIKDIYETIKEQKKEVKTLYRGLKHLTTYRRADQLVLAQAFDQIGWPEQATLEQAAFEEQVKWMDISIEAISQTIQTIENIEKKLIQLEKTQRTMAQDTVVSSELPKNFFNGWKKQSAQFLKELENLAPLLQEHIPNLAETLEKAEENLSQLPKKTNDVEITKQLLQELANFKKALIALPKEREHKLIQLQERKAQTIKTYWEKEQAHIQKSIDYTKRAKEVLKKLPELENNLAAVLQEKGLNLYDYVEPAYESDYENNYTSQELTEYLHNYRIDLAGPPSILPQTLYQSFVTLNMVNKLYTSLYTNHREHFEHLLKKIGQSIPITEQACLDLLQAIPGLQETIKDYYPYLVRLTPSPHECLSYIILDTIISSIPKPLGQIIQLRTMNKIKKNMHLLKRAIKIYSVSYGL